LAVLAEEKKVGRELASTIKASNPLAPRQSDAVKKLGEFGHIPDRSNAVD